MVQLGTDWISIYNLLIMKNLVDILEKLDINDVFDDYPSTYEEAVDRFLNTHESEFSKVIPFNKNFKMRPIKNYYGVDVLEIRSSKENWYNLFDDYKKKYRNIDEIFIEENEYTYPNGDITGLVNLKELYKALNDNVKKFFDALEEIYVRLQR